MSSGVDSGGVVAAAVALPVAAAFGVGWLAWQGGKLLVDANAAVDRQIEEKKRQLEAAAAHRKRAALAAHTQLVDMCSQLLTQLNSNGATASVIDFSEMECLKAELDEICQESIPDDVAQIESLTSLGYLKMEKVLTKQQHLASLKVDSGGDSLYRGLAVADLMDDLRIALSAIAIQVTEGKNVQAADPVILERTKLNERLSAVTARVINAINHIAEINSVPGVLTSGNTWFHSCFNGVDEQIRVLYSPSTSNAELKKGIKKLEERLEQYEMLLPSIEKEQKRFLALYQVYVDAAKALGEPVASKKSFDSLQSLEATLHLLKKRSERAQICSDIYKKLGAAAYICYAWDQELQALGYSVHTRTEIKEMAKHKPKHAKLGENKLPFYHWNDGDLTQLYSMSEECSLQVIVHDDGSVSMKSITDSDNVEDAKTTQKTHCALLKKLHENLRKNWFVIYDYTETASPEEITSISGWFGSEESAWQPDEIAESVQSSGRRKRDTSETKAKHIK